MHVCECRRSSLLAPCSYCVPVAQAPPPERKTARRKGVINVPKSDKDKEERNPQLPTSVPMPSSIEDICDPGMRAMWDMDGEAPPEPLGA